MTTAAAPEPITVETRLLAHCAALAAQSPTGEFEMPLATAAETLGVSESSLGPKLWALANEGLLLRMRKATNREPARYRLPGGADDGPAPLPANARRCTVCGRIYAALGDRDACPGYLSHAAVRAVARRVLMMREGRR